MFHWDFYLVWALEVLGRACRCDAQLSVVLWPARRRKNITSQPLSNLLETLYFLFLVYLFPLLFLFVHFLELFETEDLCEIYKDALAEGVLFDSSVHAFVLTWEDSKLLHRFSHALCHLTVWAELKHSYQFDTDVLNFGLALRIVYFIQQWY